MRVVILAGGLGTRLSEETGARPKPMVEIGGHPMLWHIMKHYAHYGFTEFLCALGYKGEVIKRYFLDSYQLRGGLTVHRPRYNVLRLARSPQPKRGGTKSCHGFPDERPRRHPQQHLSHELRRRDRA
jgi:choline kinase